MNNIFSAIPADQSEEHFEPLLETGDFRIERIVSFGQSSPPGYWYDQEQAEWVMLLQGAARLQLANPDKLVELKPGDWINLAAHEKHRVEWTTPDEPTIWLAIHYSPKDAG